eukprot:CAMPEP_0179448002 /NCGR_PEP_ID=MMETSP0799-20121207/31797_1 /TAXON_ID=46947 /ORGANISM="Geminigera cryophila, Strain CCMP2564" /LENGTH=103 /DNA_ID=CAMNT_0021239307 /DNA_START=273 /DNA_END=584 /DNA_ORIENTATION=+
MNFFPFVSVAFLSTQFADIAHATQMMGDQHTQALYFYRPWMRSQNEGYINYTRIAAQDHSYAYDSSTYQDPTAHSTQKEAHGAYKHRKDFLKILNWEPTTSGA